MLTQRAWTRTDRLVSVAFVAALDTQVLLGLSLYFLLSPLVPKSLAQFKAIMPIGPLRFIAVEHITMMLLALVAAHVTSVLCKRPVDSRARYRRLTWGVAITLTILFLAIPWPWTPAARPFIRGF